MGESDFDAVVEAAWVAFCTDLGHRIAGLVTGTDPFSVEQNSAIPEGSHGSITFTRTGAHRLRATITELDLAHHRDSFANQMSALDALGWRHLRNGTFIYEVARRNVGDLALLATTSFRQIWEVMHPAFLDDEGALRREPALAVATLPHSDDELRALVATALESMTGVPVAIDDDGDIPLPTGDVQSWLRVMPGRPTLEFFGAIVTEVDDLAAACEYVASESLQWPGIKVVVDDCRVLAALTVEVTAFSSHNLAAGLGQWLQFIDETRPTIVAMLCGKTPPLPAAALPETLQTVIELDGEDAHLEPHEVALICGHDRRAILGYIRTCEQQYLAWRDTAEQADLRRDEAKSASAHRESRDWQATTAKLRAALRIVVLDDGDRNFRPTAG